MKTAVIIKDCKGEFWVMCECDGIESQSKSRFGTDFDKALNHAESLVQPEGYPIRYTVKCKDAEKIWEDADYQENVNKMTRLQQRQMEEEWELNVSLTINRQLKSKE